MRELRRSRRTGRLGPFVPDSLDRGRTSSTRTALSGRSLGTDRSRLWEKYVLDGERSSRSARLRVPRWYGVQASQAVRSGLALADDDWQRRHRPGLVSGECPAEGAGRYSTRSGSYWPRGVHTARASEPRGVHPSPDQWYPTLVQYQQLPPEAVVSPYASASPTDTTS